MITREYISERFIHGLGLEIGAFHNPFPIKKESKVIYLDKCTKSQLIKAFPEITNHQNIPETNLIDDGEICSKVPVSSYDFLISSHQLEHCQSPLQAICNHLRIVKQYGILFYAVPDKRFTFDKDRPVSEIRCLVDDYYSHEINLEKHYDEYFLNVDKMTDPVLRKKRTKECIASGSDIHFHAWDSKATFEIFSYCQTVLNFNFDVELYSRSGHENLIVLRKL